MASILYREVDGAVEEVRVEYDQYEAHISAGWSPDDPRVAKEQAPKEDEVGEDVDGPQDDENHASEPEPEPEPEPEGQEAEMTGEQVRAAAKEAGIEGWDTKRIATLRKALDSK